MLLFKIFRKLFIDSFTFNLGEVESSYGATGTSSFATGKNVEASGNYSHAEGGYTEASGNFSHSEGYSARASGLVSHAEGYGSKASGNASHAEGFYSEAIGYVSHAEGYKSKAIGLYSHAEGKENEAIGDYSHAQNGNDGYSKDPTKAGGMASHTEGAGTRTGNFDSGDEPDPDDNYLNDGSGKWAHAEGRKSIASGDASHAEGYNAIASGYASHAEGYGSIASKDHSHAEGYYTKASGDNSHAEGSETKAIGYASHAEGYNAKTETQGLFTFDRVVNNTSLIEINSVQDGGAEDWDLYEKVGETYFVYAVNWVSDADEYGYVRIFDRTDDRWGVFDDDYIEVTSGKVKLDLSTTPFTMTISSDSVRTESEVSLTDWTVIIDDNAFIGSTITGDYAHAEGYYVEAGGIASHASGSYTRAVNNNQTVIGQYNSPVSGTLFEVGNGNSDSTRSNALEVHSAGPILAPSLDATEITDNKCLVTLEYLFSAEFGNSLPTSDPEVAGKLWNDEGVLKVSLGT